MAYDGHQQALATCSRADAVNKNLQPIWDATKLLLFFGVPHRGLETYDFRKMVLAIENEVQRKHRTKIVDILDDDSEFLEEYRQEMAHFLGPPRTLISMYEQESSASIIQVRS